MPSPNTLALRAEHKQLVPDVVRIAQHSGANREERRHVVPPRVALHVMPPKITIPKAAQVPASNTPHLSRMALVAPQLSRRDRRIALRDPALKHAA